MNRTLIYPDLQLYPPEIRPLLQNADLYDSSCSPETKVIFIDKEGGYFLKSAAKGALEREAAQTRWFHRKGLAAEVLSYISGEQDWLLTARIPGEDCIHAAYLADPKRLCDKLAEILRRLHDTDYTGCPVQDHRRAYLSTARRNYKAGHFDLSYCAGYFDTPSAEDAWREIEKHAHLLQNDTLLHGDYCLPNVLLNNWDFSGFIDLGNGGVGDRHVDVYWGVWTLAFNLKTDRYADRFLDAYGRDRVEPEMLRLVAACEVFG